MELSGSDPEHGLMSCHLIRSSEEMHEEFEECTTQAVHFDWTTYLKEGLPDYQSLETDSEHSQLSEDEDTSVSESVEVSGSELENGLSSQVVPVACSSEPTSGTHKAGVVSDGCMKRLLWYKEGFEAEEVLNRELHSVDCAVSNIESRILLTKWDVKEYHIIREILWGLSTPPRKLRFFDMKDGSFHPHTQLSIEGVSQNTLQCFLAKMCHYMNTVLILEAFGNSVKEYCEEAIPKTLLAYNTTLNEFIQIFKNQIEEIELRVKQQNGIETLHQIYRELNPWLDQLEFVVEVHLKATKHWETLSNWYIAMRLLTVWFDAALDISLRQHVTTAARIFLSTFQPYCSIIDEWLNYGELIDPCGEFFIYINADVPWSDAWLNKFVVHDLDILDGHVLPAVLCPNVLPVLLTAGKSAHILKELDAKEIDALTEIDESPVDQDTFLQLLHALETAFSQFEINDEPGDELCVPLEVEPCFEDAHNANDTPLPIAVAKYVYCKQDEYYQLFEKIAEHTGRMFLPFQEIFVKKLLMLLKPRAEVFGIMLNHVIIKKYHFYSRLSMMRTLFFMDHPDFLEIYTSFLQNSLRLQFNQIFPTLQLHVEETMESMYPGNGQGWYSIIINHEAFNNKYKVIPFLQSISFSFQMEWPLSLIFHPDHQYLFNEIFHFLLPLKWALYTATHLDFHSVDTGFCSARIKQCPTGIYALRFWILTSLNAITTFFVDHIMRCYGEKMVNAMNHATDFDMIVTAYNEYMLEIKNLFCYLGTGGKLRSQINNLIRLTYDLDKLWMPNLVVTEENVVSELKLRSSSIHVNISTALDDILLQEPTGSDGFVHYEALHMVFQQNNLPQY